jgi:hypothetical protein
MLECSFKFQILASKLIKNIKKFTKNIYESIMMTHPMTQDLKKIEIKYWSLCTIHDKKIKGMNKTLNYTAFERKEEI